MKSQIENVGEEGVGTDGGWGRVGGNRRLKTQRRRGLGEWCGGRMGD